MAGSSFGEYLIRILFASSGAPTVKKDIKDVAVAAQQLQRVKVTEIFDANNVMTGRQIEKNFKVLNPHVAKAKGMMDDFGNAMRRALIVAPVWMVLRSAMMGVTNLVKEQTKFLIDLETAMTRIKIVGKGTTEEYAYLQQGLVSLAYAYGTTASEAADAAVIFAQQGRTVKETIELTRVAMIASKILGTDLKTTVDDLTAAVEGFGLGTDNSIAIVDRWINVEKQFAVTSKDLANATKVAGATANQLGITMHEFAGDITAAVEVTRKSGEEVARGLSFIYARLLTSGKKTVEQITKIPFYLDKAGNSTNAMGGEMRSISAILGELASKWNDLSKEERLEIATALGSKRQMTILNALMQNYNTSLDARVASLTAAGSAEKAFALIQDTTAYKIKQVSAAWNVLTTSVGDTSGFKLGLSVLDDLIIKLASVFSYEKAYSALLAQKTNKELLSLETTKNQIKSLEELLEARKKLLQSPKTGENLFRLDKIQAAINTAMGKDLRLKAAIDFGNGKIIKRQIEESIGVIELKIITTNVDQEFDPKIAAVEEKIRKLNLGKGTTGTSVGMIFNFEANRKLVQYEKEINKLAVDRNKAIKEQVTLQKGQVEAARLMAEAKQAEEDNANELTSKELARLDIEKELTKLKYSGADSSILQIAAEMKMISLATTLYGEREKTLKLEELGNKLLDARLQKRDQELKKVESLLFQYEQADGKDRGRIRRQIELQQMSPEGVVQAYEGGGYDKNLIMENISSFTEEIRTAISTLIAKDRGFTGYLTEQGKQREEVASISQTASFGDININLSQTEQGLLSTIISSFKRELQNNEDFKKFIAQQIQPKL